MEESGKEEKGSRNWCKGEQMLGDKTAVAYNEKNINFQRIAYRINVSGLFLSKGLQTWFIRRHLRRRWENESIYSNKRKGTIS